MSLLVDIKKKLKGFTLEVAFSTEGAPLGVLGASGSGKSMTLKCIAGIETPSEGRIELDGRVLFDSARKINLRPQQRKVGYLFQNYALFPNMTVAQNIACALQGTRAEKKARAYELAGRFELGDLEERYPSQLSGGQQQRAALARTLAGMPKALLLDEPFSALDGYLREAMQVEMMHLLKDFEGDVVMVSHSRDEIYRFAEDLLLLDEGQVLGHGPTKQLFDKPGRLEAARLTGCKNFSRAKKAGESMVDALDWGCRLQVAGPVPDELTHVGVRAHDFYPPAAGEADAPNRINIVVREKVESPFEWNILVRNADADADAEAGSGVIWWKVPKENMPAELPAALCVRPEKVLLLAGGQ